MGWIVEVGDRTDVCGVGSLRKSSDMIRLSGFYEYIYRYRYGTCKNMSAKSHKQHAYIHNKKSLTMGVLKNFEAKEPKLPVLDLLCNGRDPCCFG